MDIFFTEKYIALLKKVFINPRSRVEYFLWWMNALFWTLKSQHKKLWRARAFLNITLIVFVWKNKVIYTRLAWGWVNHAVIFIFGWTISLNLLFGVWSLLPPSQICSWPSAPQTLGLWWTPHTAKTRMSWGLLGSMAKKKIGIQKWFSWNTIKVIMKSHRCWSLTCGLTSRIQMRPASTTSWMESILVP